MLARAVVVQPGLENWSLGSASLLVMAKLTHPGPSGQQKIEKAGPVSFLEVAFHRVPFSMAKVAGPIYRLFSSPETVAAITMDRFYPLSKALFLWCGRASIKCGNRPSSNDRVKNLP
jgi:hypothetical protein